MKEQTNRAKSVPLAFVIGSTLLITGCEDGSPFNFKGKKDAGPTQEQTKSGDAGASLAMAETEVEAPEVFSASEDALWDGRPSLGGVWVAYPDVKKPEQVVIRNTANNKTVNGALFRRERDNPGPKIQVSSDAAEALGMVAGQPTELSLVALRKKEVPAQNPVVPAGPVLASESGKTKSTSEKDGMKEGAEAKKSGNTTPDVAMMPLENKAKKTTQKAGKKDTTDPAEAAKSAIARLEAEAANDKTKYDVPEIKVPEAAGSAAAGDEMAVATERAAAAAMAPEKSESRLSRPYLQIGSFSSKQDAETALAAMRTNGLSGQIKEVSSGSNTIWRVLAGPAKSIFQRGRNARKLRKIGYKNVYPVED